jgi:asparagine synthase (glutamine-hydrolysing)
MLGSMVHEPWYQTGTYENQELGLWVGWTVHPDSFSDCMPVWNAGRDLCLIFAGDDYGDARPERADARRLIDRYEREGERFFASLNGWFSGLVIDLRRREIFLFNDRFGLGRINYHQTPERTLFASEAKALLAVAPQLRRIDPAALAETFSCGCALGDKTIFDGVSLLPAGSLWTFAGKRNTAKDRYFDRSRWENQEVLADEAYYGQLLEVFPHILQRYLLEDRGALAISLTGGLDGRMIMAWAHPAAGALPCYTFGGSYRDCADVRIARRIAASCGQSHETLSVGPEFLGQFPELAERCVYLSDGTMDVTGAVEVFANRLAHRIAPVRLTGNYGSEIVRGNIAFRPGSLDQRLLEPGFAGLVDQAAARYQAEREGHRVSFIAFKQTPWHHYARLSVEQSQISVRSPFLDNDLVQLMYRASPAALLEKQHTLRLIAQGNPALAAIPTDRGLRLPEIPLLSRLHHQLQEFTAKAEYAYDYGMPRKLAAIDHRLRQLRLERLFLGRHKFYHFRLWYRDQLGPYLKDILLDPRTLGRPYFNSGFIRHMVESHTAGRENYTREIHRVLTTELTLRQLLERPTP